MNTKTLRTTFPDYVLLNLITRVSCIARHRYAFHTHASNTVVSKGNELHYKVVQSSFKSPCTHEH